MSGNIVIPTSITWERILTQLHPGYKLLMLSREHISVLTGLLDHLLRVDGCKTDPVTGRMLLDIMTELNGPGMEESRIVATELALENTLDGWESWVRNSPVPAESINQAVLDHIAAVRKLLKK